MLPYVNEALRKIRAAAKSKDRKGLRKAVGQKPLSLHHVSQRGRKGRGNVRGRGRNRGKPGTRGREK